MLVANFKGAVGQVQKHNWDFVTVRRGNNCARYPKTSFTSLLHARTLRKELRSLHKIRLFMRIVWASELELGKTIV